VLVVVALTLPSSAAAAAGGWVVHGAGFGHGVGMSAYGAYGYAKHGFGYARILGHYFVGTQIVELPRAPLVRVLLQVTPGDVSFTKATTACGRKLSPSQTYRARRSGSSVRLLSGAGAPEAACGKRLHAEGAGQVEVHGLGAYRGALEATPTSGSPGALNVVNRLDVDSYVQGVLPSELPPLWPNAALRAMAVAMRSVALTSHAGGSAFDVYSDTRTQLYHGLRAETSRTNAAAAATRSRVVTYRGKIAQTPYFSSSGGRTESGFLGAPKVPYLTSVDDPYDYYSPLHRWTLHFSQAEMDARLRPYLKGSLQRIRVTKRGDSPRIVSARLIATGGTTTVRGDALAGALGLYSRWAYFKKA
jgi:stage II sporulation protein D